MAGRGNGTILERHAKLPHVFHPHATISPCDISKQILISCFDDGKLGSSSIEVVGSAPEAKGWRDSEGFNQGSKKGLSKTETWPSVSHS